MQEEFNFDFLHKSHEQKRRYITIMEHVVYCEHLNSPEDEHLLMNKHETYSLLKDYYKRDVILVRDEGDFAGFSEFVDAHPTFVVKPVDAYRGRGIRKETVDGLSERDKRALFDSLAGGDCGSGVVLEEVIDQGDEMAVLHPQSVNCVRINTVRAGDEIVIYRPWMKMGAGGNFVTAAFLHSPCAGINLDTGIVETDGITEYCDVYERHPDTGVAIKGFQIPHWAKLKEMAVEVANKFPDTDIIGWDMVWSKRGWCVMEGNYKPEFVWQWIWGFPGKEEFENLIGWHIGDDFWWQARKRVRG